MPFADPDRAERRAFLAAASAILAAFAWFILRPLAGPLLFAILTAVIAYPLHQRIERRARGFRVLAGMISILLLTLVVALPAFGLGALFWVQAREVIAELLGEDSARSRLTELAHQATTWASDLVAATVGNAIDVPGLVQAGARQAGAALYERVPDLVSLAGRVAIGAFLYYFVLFVLLIRGPEIVNLAIELLPIGESRSRRILKRLEGTIKGVFLGSIATAFVQGIVATVGFWLLGFENQVVWGVLVAFAGLIPMVGTGLILIPATLYFAFTGQGSTALALAVITLIVGTVDNLIKPLLIHEHAAVHPLLVFVALFGGLRTFGGLGLLYGPLLIACLTEMVRIYRAEFSRRPLEPAGGRD